MHGDARERFNDPYDIIGAVFRPPGEAEAPRSPGCCMIASFEAAYLPDLLGMVLDEGAKGALARIRG